MALRGPRRCDNIVMNYESTEMRADLSKEPAEVAAMFDQVAKRYDLVNDLASLGQVYIWRHALVQALEVSPGMKILDVAAGTGTSANALARAGAQVVACDLSAGMIAVGKERYPDLDFVQGDATNLPFGDEEFDAVTISFGIRNVQDPEAALREFLRVTKPGGTLVVCEFSAPQSPWFNSLYRWYLGTALPPVARVASSDGVAYDYLAESILAWPDQVSFGRMIAACGWERVEYRNLTGGIVCLHRARKALAPN